MLLKRFYSPEQLRRERRNKILYRIAVALMVSSSIIALGFEGRELRIIAALAAWTAMITMQRRIAHAIDHEANELNPRAEDSIRALAELVIASRRDMKELRQEIEEKVRAEVVGAITVIHRKADEPTPDVASAEPALS